VHLIPFIRQVLAMTKPYRMRFILGVVCGILAGITTPFLMGSVKLVVDTVFAEPGAPSLIQKMQKAPPFLRGLVEHILPSVETWNVQSSNALTLLVIATVPLAMLLRGLFGYLNVYLMNWVSIRAINDLRARLFDHLMGLSSSFFSDTSTGTLMAHLNAAAALWHLWRVSSEILDRARYPFPAEPVRTLDAIHLASALAARSVVPGVELLSLDDRIRRAGAQLGFRLQPQ